MSKDEFERIREQYSKIHHFGGRVGFGKRPALIVIDMENYATDRKCPLYGGPIVMRALRNIGRLLPYVRRKGIPVFYTRIAWEGSYEREMGVMGRKLPELESVRLGSEWAEIDKRVDPQEGDTVIIKKRFSAFFGTNLLGMLVSGGIDTLILTGHSTSGCVRSTAIDATSLGFRVVVPEECVGDRADLVHKANLFDMDAKLADVVPLSEVLKYVKGLPSRRRQQRTGHRESHDPIQADPSH